MRLLFDRGTLILTDVPSGLDPADLPGCLWDPRVGRFRAPAHRGAELVDELGRRGQGVALPWRDPPPDEVAPARWAAPPLRPYQEAALTAWEMAGRRGLVVLPTGAGKTRLALAALARAATSALCLVPTRVLLAQWLEALRGVHRGPVGCLGDGSRDVRAVTVATFESAWRGLGALGDRFRLLVVDEAHHFGRGARDEALEMALAPWRLGLSATPPEDALCRARLEALVGPPVYELGLADLAGRFLAPFALRTVAVELEPAERRDYERDQAAFRAAWRPFRRVAPEGSWSEFLRAARGSEAGRQAVAAWRRMRRLLAFPAGKARALAALLARHRDERLLLFTADNETAYRVAREHLVMPITCDIGRAERAAALARFARGELRALVSSRVLDEGLDLPEVGIGVVVGGSAAGRQHVQRIGRLLRPLPGKQALVYELVVAGTGETWQLRRRRGALAARQAP